MFQNRSLGREESLLRHGPTTTANLVDHPGEWYEIGPAFPDEHWKVATLNLTLAGDGLLQNLRGFGGAGGVLEIGLFLADGLGGVGDLAPLVFHGITSAKEWEAGSHAGTLVDLKAGNYHDGRPRAGLRGDLRQAASGTGQWTSAPQALRYGRQIDAVSWEADLIRDDRIGRRAIRFQPHPHHQPAALAAGAGLPAGGTGGLCRRGRPPDVHLFPPGYLDPPGLTLVDNNFIG